MEDVVEPLDVNEELEEVIKAAEPNLKDAIKRSFTNLAVQRSTSVYGNGTTIPLTDVFFVDNDDNQISLQDLQVSGCSSFHLSRVELSLSDRRLVVSALAGAAAGAEGGPGGGPGGGTLTATAVYRAACPALQALLPVTADGRIRVVFSGVKVEGGVGLDIRDDSFFVLNTDLEVTVEEVTLTVSHCVPKKDGGEEVVTSELCKDSIEKLPLVERFHKELFYRLQQELVLQLDEVLHKTTSVSEILGGNPDLIETFSTSILAASSSGNMVVDLILMEVRKNFLQKCNEIVRLPDLHANFSRKVGLVTVHGQFETNEGWLLDLATIDRTNDVTLSFGVSRSSLIVSMGLTKMKVGFDEYRLKFMNIGPTGRIEAIIGENSIHMKISAGISRWKPYATIDDLKIKYFGDVDIHITGLGPLNWLVSTISTWVSGHIKNIAIPIVEKQIRAEIQKAIDGMTIWELLTVKKPLVVRT